MRKLIRELTQVGKLKYLSFASKLIKDSPNSFFGWAFALPFDGAPGHLVVSLLLHFLWQAYLQTVK